MINVMGASSGAVGTKEKRAVSSDQADGGVTEATREEACSDRERDSENDSSGKAGSTSMRQVPGEAGTGRSDPGGAPASTMAPSTSPGNHSSAGRDGRGRTEGESWMRRASR